MERHNMKRISVQLEALKIFYTYHSEHFSNESLANFTEKICQLICSNGHRNNIVTKDIATYIVEEFSEAYETNTGNISPVQVVDMFGEIPTPMLDKEENKLKWIEPTGLKVFASPKSLLERYKIRYELLLSLFLQTAITDPKAGEEKSPIGTLCWKEGMRKIETFCGMNSCKATVFGILNRSEKFSVQSLNKRNPIILILSDVWLNEESVFYRLQVLLRSLQTDQLYPDAVILMGDFLSYHTCFEYGNDHHLLQNGFRRLALLFGDYLKIEKTQLIVIPGPNDMGCAEILPRSPIPSFFLSSLQNFTKWLHTTSNPVRMIVEQHHMVIFRDDIQQKMASSSIFPLPNEATKMREMLVKTLLDQAHLCPLAMDKQPVLWHHEHSLWLFPSPKYLVLGDGLEAFHITYGHTECYGTGSFAIQGSFLIYDGNSEEFSICCIDKN
eukprot:jgi/Galph1/1522/GphlegSOOS_G202.1